MSEKNIKHLNFVSTVDDPKNLDDKYWKDNLTTLQYEVCRNAATEHPHTGEYTKHFEEGTYVCSCCGQKLFHSQSKFDSGCGWPSFYECISDECIDEKPDYSLLSERTEILCSKCNSHLGHVFNDGPQPTGLRYCVNSVSIYFKK